MSAFLDYMNGDTAKNILRRQRYIPCIDGQQNLMDTLCRQ